MSEKRFLWSMAFSVAQEICNALGQGCERIEIAGSLRREKPDVGDIEILYIPIQSEEPDPTDMFANRLGNLADARINVLLGAGILAKRRNAKGSEVWGEKNKLAVHVASGIPVDLFTATSENWFNYLVCRTGPAELNQRICMAAIKRGWKWNPYGEGFSDPEGNMRKMESERAVFDFVGLPYFEPDRRV